MTFVVNIKEKLENLGQNHLLQFWDDLTEDEKVNFLKHLENISFDNANKLFERALNSLNEDVKKLDDKMEPVPSSLFESELSVDENTLNEYRNIGYEQISNGHVAVLLMAGGQGTRLGVSYPKGMFSIGLPSNKTLFQIQAERIQSLIRLAAQKTGKTGIITWYIMTSGPTNEMTENFLKQNNYFGLNPKNVILFQQGQLPCYDFSGKIFLAEKDQVALAPDGNGGIYRALLNNGILDDMERKSIKYVHVHNVDNILVKVADPVFIGYCIKKDAECGAKVVSKSGPLEAVGVVCKVDGVFQVVEYSEITEHTANLRNTNGDLVFSAGSICNHFFTTKFLQRVCKENEHELKLHVARKKIPYVNKKGEKIQPQQPNGIKIEKFVFDVFQFANKFVTWEVARNSEFSALKNSNAVGKDCPTTARRDLLNLHRMYVEKAGGIVECDEIEISPLLSYAGENLENYVKGKTFSKPTILKAEEEYYVKNGKQAH